MKKGLMRFVKVINRDGHGEGACGAVRARNAAKYNTSNVGNH